MDIYFDLIELVRTEILEQFMIPGLGISWWRFAIYMALATIVVVALVNAVRVTSGKASGHSYVRRNDKGGDDDV